MINLFITIQQMTIIVPIHCITVSIIVGAVQCMYVKQAEPLATFLNSPCEASCLFLNNLTLILH